tara:strand:- start:12751 stop:14022 length:1272 start_codon:yes stop_codon:yes gene_type:complete
MLQVNYLKGNQESVRNSLLKRNIDYSIEINKAIELDEKRKKTQTNLDSLLSDSNTIAKSIGDLFKSGKIEEANNLKEKSTQIKPRIKELQENLSKIKLDLESVLYTIPNIPHPLVKQGKDDAYNEIIFESKSVDQNENNILPHWELAKNLDIIDFELGNKITGAGFPLYKGKGAKLQRGLINYFLDKNTDAGYHEIQPPILINENSGYGTGQLPDKEGQMYHVENDNLYLIPTAEVPITNIYRDTIINKNELPIKLTGYTPCFRREAGSYGSHVRGLNRLHQFDKVEIVRIESSENSYEVLDEMVDHVKSLLSELNLPFRILRLCGGDLGFSSALTYDFEVYSKVQKRWLEVSSVSNFESFQSNRLKLRIDKGNKEKELAHTLNGSALALPRVVAALLENNQEDNKVYLPKVLHSYCGFKLIN